jgi:hypothetical protein
LISSEINRYFNVSARRLRALASKRVYSTLTTTSGWRMGRCETLSRRSKKR